MAEFTTATLMCQASRHTRVYRSVYDTESSNLILCPKMKFYSRKQFVDGDTKMLHISEALDKDVPTDYWCPASTIQYFPIYEPEKESDPEPELEGDGSVAESITLSIRDTNVVVYGSSRASSAIPNGLNVGDRVICDRSIEIDSNGSIETRYRIAEVIGDDQSIVGGWILVNRAIEKPNAPKVIFHNPSVQVMSRVSAAPGVMPLDDTDNQTTQPEYNPNMVTTSDGSTLNVPLVDINGEVDESAVANMLVSTPEGQAAMFAAYGYDYLDTTTESLTGAPIGRMVFVHGMPFQWTHITDRRQGSTMDYGASESDQTIGPGAGSADEYGRSFARDIAANMPIAVFTPGKPKFMTSVNIGGDESSARNVFGQLLGDPDNSAVVDSVMSQLNDVEGEFQYYSMEIALADYYEYVNSLCWTSARLMGISSEVCWAGMTCANMDWGAFNSDTSQSWSMVASVIGPGGAGISFVFDPQSSVSDTMSTTTADSQFVSLFNDLSSKARELEFILGYTGSGGEELIDSANYVEQATSQLNTGAFAGLNNAVDRIGTWMKNAAHGMNIRFPEIWSDSTHSPSYDIDMHFIAPYATAFCKWRYVLVPFFHLFALAAPKSDTNSSQYSSPFLVRAYSKGYFNIEMGMVESLTWKRFGDGDMISEDGVPTQLDVSLSMKDLYHTLTMTSMFKSMGAFMNNTGLMDLVGTLSGVNMTRISIGDRISMYAAGSVHSLLGAPGNFMRSISDRVRNVTKGLWGT